MQEYGTVTAQIVTSAAQIPIPGATLTITQELPDSYAQTQEFDIPSQAQDL